MPLPNLQNLRSPAALASFFLTAILGLGLDLWTKHLAVQRLSGELATRYEVVPGWLEFTFIKNEGAVFGLGQGRWALFIAVSIAAILFLTYLFVSSGRQHLYQFILGMLMAGVLGNMYDRIVYGHVRDMIHILSQWGLFPWVFNVADVLLCTGVGMMVLYSVLQSKKKEQPAEDAGEAALDQQ